MTLFFIVRFFLIVTIVKSKEKIRCHKIIAKKLDVGMYMNDEQIFK